LVDIEYRPVQKIIIHEVIKYELDDFIQLKAQPRPPNAPPSIVRWADGAVFDYLAFPQTQELVNQRAKEGTIHWDFIEFAEMREYTEALGNSDGSTQAKVINVSNNTAVSDAIRWIRSQPQWSGSTGT
jgi:hypothetical protein